LTASNFPVCFAETEKWEGWHVFSDNPRDPGGKTYSGVTQRAYDGYRLGKGLPQQDVRDMSDAECEDIYCTQYWLPARGPDLPSGLDLCQYDECVNSGPVEATKLLQRALRVHDDGVFGLETLGALHVAVACGKVPDLIKGVCAARLSFWRTLKIWIYFGRGWTARDRGIEAKALAMYEASR